MLDTALSLAGELAGKPPAALGIIKSRTYGPALETLRDPATNTFGVTAPS